MKTRLWLCKYMNIFPYLARSCNNHWLEDANPSHLLLNLTFFIALSFYHSSKKIVIFVTHNFLSIKKSVRWIIHQKITKNTNSKCEKGEKKRTFLFQLSTSIKNVVPWARWYGKHSQMQTNRGYWIRSREQTPTAPYIFPVG